MPSTPIAVLLYVFMLTPGILFLMRAESHRPKSSRSAFRETALVIVVSAVCSGIVIALFLVASVFFPALADGASSFIKQPSQVASDHPRQVAFWSGVFFIATGIVGYTAGSHTIYSQLDKLIPKNEKVFLGSAWEKVLKDVNNDVVVGVQLKSGIWVQGTFAHHTHTDDDSTDRALVLQGPLRVRDKESPDLKELEHFDRMVLQSSDIEYLVSVPRARL
ncbi:DUF6338 family protein [Paenarthrobacter sp. NPDC089675]|uniref:DUF6338 family protein n=1 Tax=Paenarthrobacter sp. NPDC089675 TaxID=3364376 RepID=UPI0037F69174